MKIKYLVIGIVCLAAVVAQANTLVAGWDLSARFWDGSGSPDAGFEAAGIDGVVSGDDFTNGVSANAWDHEWSRYDSDGTFGSVVGGAGTNRAWTLRHLGDFTSSTGYLEFQVTNSGTESYDLSYFSFDAWRTYGGMDQYTVSLVAGDLGTATLGSGTFTLHDLPAPPENYDDFDIDISGYTLGGGQSATFRIDFSDSTPNAGNWFHVDNVAIVAVTPAPLTPHQNLVGYWDFEGDTTSVLIDKSDNGNNALVQSSGTLQYSADTPFSSGSSLSLDGTAGTSAQALDSASLSVTGSLSMVAWVKTADGASGDLQILSKNHAAYRWRMGGVNAANGNFQHVVWIDGVADSSFIEGSGSPVANWMHLVAVYDEVAGEKYYFRNGVLVETFTAANSPTDLTDSLQIGAFLTSEVFNGLLDDVAIYNVALTTNQIAALFSGAETPLSLIPIDAGAATQADIVSIEATTNSLLKIVVDTSMPDRSSPESRSGLVLGSWTNVPHSSDGISAFVETNLSYSTVEGTNYAIYVQGTNSAAFFKIITE